jgi:hypothetical protein
MFLILMIFSLASMGALVVVGYSILAATSPYPSNWMGQMGNMMGGQTTTSAQNSAGYFGLVFIVLVALAVVSVGGLVYFVAFPELKFSRAGNLGGLGSGSVSTASVEASGLAVTPYDSVLKTLTSDERKVLEILKSHEGKYLQKYIRSESGFSRLQTHRIVARLAERGIVSLEKTGNTNAVLLTNWLK